MRARPAEHAFGAFSDGSVKSIAPNYGVWGALYARSRLGFLELSSCFLSTCDRLGFQITLLEPINRRFQKALLLRLDPDCTGVLGGTRSTRRIRPRRVAMRCTQLGTIGLQCPSIGNTFFDRKLHYPLRAKHFLRSLVSSSLGSTFFTRYPQQNLPGVLSPVTV